MSTVLLLGDSIRDDYRERVRDMLRGRAEVVWPPDSGRFALYTLMNIYGWAELIENPDDVSAIHWNNGLWDVIHIHDDPLPITLPDEYRRTNVRIIGYLRKCFPKARIIFALSTPVVESMRNNDHFRYNWEIQKYNAIAREVMLENGCEIDDLYSVMAEQPTSVHSDWVHFTTAEGSTILAQAVVKAIGLI